MWYSRKMEELKEVLQNSIELKKNAKGDYAWDIKVYFNDDKKALETIDNINEYLKNKYSN